MADGIYYNQEVTADMLNGIAHDLGYTSFNGFGVEKFGADELNKITADLVSAGVLLTGNQCRVVRTEDGKIILQDGMIVFSNGAKKIISEPLIIDADNGTVIYAYNNVVAGTCTIEVAESYPTEGDFIKLASIGADGRVLDARKSSISKALNSPAYPNNYIDLEITHYAWSGAKANEVYEGAQSIYILPHSEFKYIFFKSITGSHRIETAYIDISKLSDGEGAAFGVDSYNYVVNVLKNGPELTFTSIRQYVSSPLTEEHTMAFEIV